MNKYQRLGCLLLAMLMLLLLAGCGAQDEWDAALKMADKLEGVVEDAQLRADAEQLLDALIADDYASAWDAICQEMDAAEFKKVYEEIQPLLSGVTQYELTPSNINKGTNNGVAYVSVRYMMTAGERRVFVDVSWTEGYQGLTAFRLTDYVPVVTTGTLGNMQGANAAQWTFLVIGILELIFAIWVFVDCCRHKIRRKWLWLLLIALGYVILSVIATPEQFRINFNVGAFLSYTRLLCYSTGGATCQVVIPVGAIVYLSMRKSLFAKYAQLQQQKAAEQETVLTEEIPQQEDIPQTEELSEAEKE